MLKKLNNNKGLTSFIAVILVLLILALFSFAFDLVNIARKRHAFNRHINYVARVAARQGGFRATTPDWIERLNYQTSNDVYKLSKDVLEKNHIYEDDWVIYVGSFSDMEKNYTLKEISDTNSLFDFGEDIYIHGTVKYSWPLTGAIMNNFTTDTEYTYTRKTASEAWDRHKNDNTWMNDPNDPRLH